tara:strand:+ start:616 stop:2022 length:1407 start_codon:yes stop_codon:yes gene_type:complete
MGLLENHVPQQHYQNTHPNNGKYNHYQFVPLSDIISQFMVAYVGDEKIIRKCSRVDVAFHAQRALAELSFDTFKSFKSLEIEVSNSLTLPLPIDYINYTKISKVDSAGIKHPLYPALGKTSNPQKYQVDDNNQFLFNEDGDFISSGELLRNGSFHGGTGNWSLNVGGAGGAAQTTSVVAPGSATSGDPEVGWFYEKNSIRAYDIPEFQTFRQENVDIRSGEQYTVTYTISNYQSGSVNVVFVDENGDYSSTPERSANGTYVETLNRQGNTLVAGMVAAQFDANVLYVQARVSAAPTTLTNLTIENISITRVGDEETSTTWKNYKSHTPSENNINDYQDYQNDVYWPNQGRRFGLDPKHAQVNGSYYIDELRGLINFSSNISGETVIIDYISDTLGTDDEMQVHKFAEEAMYKSILLAVASNYMYTQQLVPRLKKEKFAAVRQAKLRLSNIKLEELTQILRGKSKQIKH